MLSATDLAMMDAVVLASLDGTLTITRPTNSTGVWLQNIETPTTIATGVRCMVMEPTAPMMTADATQSVGTTQQWEIRVPIGTNVQQNDLLTIAGSGLSFRVQDVLAPMTSYRRLLFIKASALP